MAKAKTVVSKMNEADILEACTKAGRAFAGITKVTAQLGDVVKALKASKVKIGRRNGANPCVYAIAFYDACIGGGLSPKTASNCLTAFKAAVSTGKVPSDWSNRGAKGKGKGKGAQKAATLLSKVKALYGHAEFESFASAFDAAWKADKVSTLVHYVENYLRSQGCTLK